MTPKTAIGLLKSQEMVHFPHRIAHIAQLTPPFIVSGMTFTEKNASQKLKTQRNKQHWQQITQIVACVHTCLSNSSSSPGHHQVNASLAIPLGRHNSCCKGPLWSLRVFVICFEGCQPGFVEIILGLKLSVCKKTMGVNFSQYIAILCTWSTGLWACTPSLASCWVCWSQKFHVSIQFYYISCRNLKQT